MRLCIVENCGNLHHAKGYCSKHHSRISRYGDANYVSPTIRPDCRKVTLKEALLKHVILTEGDECWNWKSSITHRGYGEFTYLNKLLRAHRASYEVFKGEIPKGLFVLHTCDNRRCSNPNHLFLGTNKDNMQDMVNKNRQAVGERNTNSVLTADKVKQIKKLLTIESNISSIARQYSVDHKTIRQIRDNKTWRHIG